MELVNTKNIDKYLMLKDKYQDYVILIKSGNFYYSYLKDAFIIRYFFNYQMQGNRIGFPVSVKDKVIKLLKNNNIMMISRIKMNSLCSSLTSFKDLIPN